MAHTKTPGLLMAGVGSILSSMTIAGFLLGFFTDLWLDTKPLFFLCFGLLGLIGGVLKAYKLLSHPEFNRIEKRDDKRS